MGLRTEGRETIMLESIINQLSEMIKVPDTMIDTGSQPHRALERGMELLDAAIAFCRGQHRVTTFGLSGAYVTSVLARANQFDRSMQDFVHFLEAIRGKLQGVNEGEQPEEDLRSLRAFIETTQAYLKEASPRYDYESEPSHWRL